MVEIKDFPSYGWICKLKAPRYFSGSIGTSGTKGTFVVPVFHYRIWIEDDSLHASNYVKTPDGSITGNAEMTWELSGENAENAKSWLSEQVERHPEVKR